jgi:hypothetical protein
MSPTKSTPLFMVKNINWTLWFFLSPHPTQSINKIITFCFVFKPLMFYIQSRIVPSEVLSSVVLRVLSNPCIVSTVSTSAMELFSTSTIRSIGFTCYYLAQSMHLHLVCANHCCSKERVHGLRTHTTWLSCSMFFFWCNLTLFHTSTILCLWRWWCVWIRTTSSN